MVVTFSTMVTNTLDSMWEVNQKVTDNINGLMVQHIQVILKKEWNTAKVNGQELQVRKVISMRAVI